MTNATYTQVTSATIDALKSTAQSENKLANAGAIVRAFYGTPEAFMAVRKQFEADAIVPALEAKHRAALAVEIPRGEKSATADAARDAKKTARGFVASYFSKIKAHAFPTPKAENEPREPSLAFVEDLIKLAKKGQKLEGAEFNLIKVMAFLNGALKEVGIANLDSEAE
jgi:hypothetical protein